MLDVGAAEAKLNELMNRLAALETERDEYKRLYVALLEAYRKLEAGLVGQKRERFVAGDGEQLALSLMSMLVGNPPPLTPEKQQIEAHERRKPTGRKPLPDKPEHPRIGDPVRQHPQQPLVVDRVEEAADVGIEHPVHALAHDRGVYRR